MSHLPHCVVKVGGSLFDLPDLADRLRGWLAEQPPAHHVLVAGGGTLVEQVRRWHELCPLSDEAAHWMCVDLMTVTAHMLHDWLPEIPLVEDDRLLSQRVGERGCTIFGPAQWLRHSEPNLSGLKLPANWDVTSDSIAARLAIVLQAQGLVLLKSTLASQDSSLQQLVADGYLDAQMFALGPELPMTHFVDFRDISCKTIAL